MSRCENCHATQGPFVDPDGLGKMCGARKGASQKEREQRVRECNERREKWYVSS